MGLLNHLFGSKSSVANEMESDLRKRLIIWARAKRTYSRISELSKKFSPKNVQATLQDKRLLEQTLNEVQSWISEELVEIKHEVKNEEEILHDLERLTAPDSRPHTESLIKTLSVEHNNQENILPILEKIFNVYKTALHTIQLVREKISREERISQDILLNLFKLIFHQLDFLYTAFDRGTYYDKDTGNKIHAITRAVIVGEALKKEEQKGEVKFIQYMLDILEGDSEHYFRNLGHKIFSELADLAWKDTSDKTDDYMWIENFEKYLNNDDMMLTLANKHHRKAEEKEMRLIVVAFRKSYDLRHFEAWLMHVIAYQRENPPS